MKNAKRILAMLLCLVMCFSLLPVSAMAEEGTIEAAEHEGTIIATEDKTEEHVAEEESAFLSENIGAAEEAAEKLVLEEKRNEQKEIQTIEEPIFEKTDKTYEEKEFSKKTDILLEEDSEAEAVTLKESEAAEVYLADSGTCGDDLTWTLSNDGELTISGTGRMTNYTSSESPFYTHRSYIRKVMIEEGVTSIGNYAFYQCTAITEVTIPEGVTSIGERAFYSCNRITEIPQVQARPHSARTTLARAPRS